MARQVRQEHQVIVVLQVHLGPLDHQGLVEPQVHLEVVAHQVHQEIAVHQELLEHLVKQVHQEQVAHQVIVEAVELLVPLARLERVEIASLHKQVHIGIQQTILVSQVH